MSREGKRFSVLRSRDASAISLCQRKRSCHHTMKVYDNNKKQIVHYKSYVKNTHVFSTIDRFSGHTV